MGRIMVWPRPFAGVEAEQFRMEFWLMETSVPSRRVSHECIG